MWFLKAILGVVFLAGVLALALWDKGQTVDLFLQGPSRATWTRLDLPVALVGTLCLGILIGFIMAFFQVVSAKSEVAGMRRRNRELSRELTDLRNMPVKDLDPNLISGSPDDDAEV